MDIMETKLQAQEWVIRKLLLVLVTEVLGADAIRLLDLLDAEAAEASPDRPTSLTDLAKSRALFAEATAEITGPMRKDVIQALALKAARDG